MFKKQAKSEDILFEAHCIRSFFMSENSKNALFLPFKFKLKFKKWKK